MFSEVLSLVTFFGKTQKVYLKVKGAFQVSVDFEHHFK